jgi:D-amino peptidase
MGGIDGSYGVVLFVGHHAMEGTQDGIVNHTFLGRTINRLTLNGRAVGEMGCNGAIAGHFGVPVGMESGDDKAVAEALSFYPTIETVVVKHGMDRFVADSMAPAASRPLIRQAAERAVRRAIAGDFKPTKIPAPVTFEVEFKTTAETRYATSFPSVKRTGPKSVSVTADDVATAFGMLWGVLELGRAGANG